MMKQNHKTAYNLQRGLTLIELMVSLVLTLFVIAIAIGVLSSAGLGYKTTNAASQMNDASMSVSHIIRRGIAQAGYQPVGVAEQFTREAYYSYFGIKPHPDIYGRSNQNGATTSAVITAENIKDFYAGTGAGGLATTANSNSDLIAIRFQAVPELDPETTTPKATSTLDLCTGKPLVVSAQRNYRPSDLQEMHKPIYLLFAQNNLLYCVSWVPGEDPASTSNRTTVTPIMTDVLAFRVLYGIGQKSGTAARQAPTTWKKASEMASDEWYRIRAVRFGIVFQSDKGAVPGGAGTTTLFPMGEAFASNLSDGVTVSEADGRLFKAISGSVAISNMLTPANE